MRDILVNKTRGGYVLPALLAFMGTMTAVIVVMLLVQEKAWAFDEWVIVLTGPPWLWLCYLGAKPLQRIFQPGPAMTIGAHALVVHFSGDEIPYDQITEVGIASSGEFLYLRLAPGPKLKLRSWRFLIKWDVVFTYGFAISGAEMAKEIQRRRGVPEPVTVMNGSGLVF